MIPLLVYSAIAIVVTLLHLEKHYIDPGQFWASVAGQFIAYLLLVTLAGEFTHYLVKRHNKNSISK